MKQTELVLLFIFFSLSIKAQQFKVLSKGDYSDSSFYHIEKIEANEFWICGEYGILKRMDTLGNISPINFKSNGQHLLKVVRWKDFVFLADDNGSMYRYHLKNNTWIVKEFPAYKNRCFYDFMITSNGGIILCGGTKEIAKGIKKIPHGFIAVTDTGLQNIEKVWGSFRKFVFSVSTTYEGKYTAIVFNGIQSTLFYSESGKKWKRGKSIKGLVHDAIVRHDTLLVCGSKNIHYKQDGIIGSIYPAKELKSISGSGCIWSLQPFGNELLGISRSGSICHLKSIKDNWVAIALPQVFSIYDVEVISEKKLILVGHGKRIYLAEFK
jgi:hypothetical protein